MPKFWEADEAQGIATNLIPQYHPHLATANIAYLFQDKANKYGGKIIRGTLRKCSDLDKTLHGYDFVMTLAYDQWQLLAPLEREELVDHELYHGWFKEKKDGSIEWVLRPHDIEEFIEIMKRYHGISEDYEPIEKPENMENDDEK